MTASAAIADRLFVRFLRTRDAAAFAAFFDATSGELFRVALGLAHDAACAEDAVQETFLAALDLADRFEEGRAVQPWLLGILRNKVREGRRREARVGRRERAVATSGGVADEPLLDVARDEDRERVRAALDALEEPYREVAVLRWRYGLDPGEIADSIGKPPGTVRSLLHRARERLKHALGVAVVLPSGATCLPHLADVRAQVLEAVHLQGAPLTASTVTSSVASSAVRSTASSSLTLFLGALAMKRLVVAVVLLVLVIVAGALWESDEPLSDAQPSVESTPETARRETTAPPETKPERAPELSPEVPERPALSGRVVDASGTAVVDAEVIVVTQSSARQARPESVTTRTDAEGRFHVVPPATEPLFRVIASSPGHAPTSVSSVRVGPELLIRLIAGNTLRGTVFDDRGRPVAGAAVKFVHEWQGAAFVRSALADEAGRYAIEQLPKRAGGGGTSMSRPISYVLFEAQGWAPLTLNLTSQPDTSRRLDVRLTQGARVEGQVVDAETGLPLADAEVVAWSYERGRPEASEGQLVAVKERSAVLQRTRSDAEGRFVIDGVPAQGPLPVHTAVSGSRGPMLGAVAALVAGYVPASDELPVVNVGAVIDVQIRLWRSAAVTGRVVDAAGRGVSGARVSEFSSGRLARHVPESLLQGARRTVRTDAEGRYTLDVVTCPADGGLARLYAVPGAVSGIPGAGRAHLDVTMQVGEMSTAPDIVIGSVSGGDPRVHMTITDPQGQPIWGARAQPPTGFPPTTDRDGRLELVFAHGTAGRPPKPQTVLVRAVGYVPVATPSFVPSADAPPTIEVQMRPGRTVRGSVEWADGTAAAGVAVSVVNGTLDPDIVFAPMAVHRPLASDGTTVLQYGVAVSDASGAFELRDVPPGPLLLKAQPGRERTVLRVSEDETPRLVLSDSAPVPTTPVVLEVTVIDARGDRVPQASVSLTRKHVLPTLPEPGVFRFELPVGGSLQVSAGAYGLRTAVQPITLVRGEVNRLELTLGETASLTGRVRMARGIDPRLLRVSAFPVGTGRIAAAFGSVRRDGSYVLRGLNAGRYRVEVSRSLPAAPFYVVAERVEVELALGQSLSCDLTATLGAMAQVRVPAAWTASEVIPVRVENAQGLIAKTSLLRGWTSLWVSFPPGSIRVVLDRESGAVEQRVTVEQGETATVEFTEEP